MSAEFTLPTGPTPEAAAESDAELVAPYLGTLPLSQTIEGHVSLYLQGRPCEVADARQLHARIEEHLESDPDAKSKNTKAAIKEETDYFALNNMNPDVAEHILARFTPEKVEPAHDLENGIDQYLAEIRPYRVPTPGETVALAKIMEMGEAARQRYYSLMGRSTRPELRNEWITATLGDQARELAVLCNLRLPVSYANRYPDLPVMHLADFVQQGNLGLMYSVDHFEWRRGNRFSTSATPWIMLAIKRERDRNAGITRLPINVAEQLGIARRSGREFDSQVAELDAFMDAVSMDDPVGTGDTWTRQDVEASPQARIPDDPEERAIMFDNMRELLERIPNQEGKYIIVRNLGLDGEPPETYAEIAQALGKKEGTVKAAASRARRAMRGETSRGVAKSS